MTKRKTRIRIHDLPRDMKISREEMKKVLGGIGTWPTPESPRYQILSRLRNVFNIETIPLPE